MRILVHGVLPRTNPRRPPTTSVLRLRVPAYANWAVRLCPWANLSGLLHSPPPRLLPSFWARVAPYGGGTHVRPSGPGNRITSTGKGHAALPFPDPRIGLLVSWLPRSSGASLAGGCPGLEDSWTLSRPISSRCAAPSSEEVRNYTGSERLVQKADTLLVC